MRLMLTLVPEVSAAPGSVTKHHVQAMIYSHLQGTPYEELHDRPGFKFFNFSNLFPRLDVQAGEVKHLIISSPDEGFVETLYEKLTPAERLYLGKVPFRLTGLKRFRLRPTGAFITDTPVVIRYRNRFFSFYKDRDVNYFLNTIKENAIEKYTSFTGEPFELKGPLFTRLVPYKRKKGWLDVYVRVTFNGRSKTVVGSLWKRLEFRLDNQNKEFYTFIMETGVGALNSLGFGFVNPVRGRWKVDPENR